MLGKRSGAGTGTGAAQGAGASETEPVRPPRLLSRALARELAHALCTHMLAADATTHADTLMLAAKVWFTFFFNIIY